MSLHVKGRQYFIDGGTTEAVNEAEELARIAADVAFNSGQSYAEVHASLVRAMTERMALEAEVDRLRADLTKARQGIGAVLAIHNHDCATVRALSGIPIDELDRDDDEKATPE